MEIAKDKYNDNNTKTANIIESVGKETDTETVSVLKEGREDGEAEEKIRTSTYSNKNVLRPLVCVVIEVVV